MRNDIAWIPIPNLVLDKKNPRLPERIGSRKGPVLEEEIIAWMLEDASLLDLVISISTNGFFPGEPILVVEEAGQYVVVEGNRRLAACKILLDPHKDWKRKIAIQSILQGADPSKFPQELPALVFSERRQIVDYLGYRHVTGVQSWSPVAKARYLYRLFDLYRQEMPNADDESIYRLITRKIASRVDYVKRLLTSFRLFQIIRDNGFYKIRELDEESLEFSKLSDAATKYEKIRSFLGIDFALADPLTDLRYKHLEELVHWLFEKNSQGQTRIGDSRNLTVLAEVVDSPGALEAFRGGEVLKMAALRTVGPAEQFNAFVATSLYQLKLAHEVAYRVDGFDPTAKQYLEELNALIKNLASTVRDAEKAKVLEEAPLFS